MLSSWRLYFVWKYESRSNLNLVAPTNSTNHNDLNLILGSLNHEDIEGSSGSRFHLKSDSQKKLQKN